MHLYSSDLVSTPERQALGLEKVLWSYRQLLKYLAVSTWMRQTRLTTSLQQFAQSLRAMAVASLARVTGIDRSKRLSDTPAPRKGLRECVAEITRNINDSFSVMQKTLEHVARERDEWRDVSKAVARGNVEVVSKWWVLEQTYREEKEQEQARQAEDAKQREKLKYEQRKDVLVKTAAAHKQKTLAATWDATTLWRRAKIEHMQRLFEHTVALKRRAARLQSVCAQTQSQLHARGQGEDAETDPASPNKSGRSSAGPPPQQPQRQGSPTQAWADSQPLPAQQNGKEEARSKEALPPVSGQRRPRPPPGEREGQPKNFDWKRLYGVSNAQPPPPEAYMSPQQPRKQRASPERQRKPVMPQTQSLQK